MTDFETHPAGTADLVKRLLDWTEYDEGKVNDTRHEAADRIEQLVATVEQLEAELTRANAATAAAYEVAAREVECGCGAGPCQDTTNCSAEDAAAIRALATPDQTAALDKLIAEAEARVWEKAAAIAYDYTPEKHSGATLASHVTGRSIEAAILAASKKGGV